VSRATFSTSWPVWWARIESSASRIRTISLAWISMSTAWPDAPPCGWWISTRECGSTKRLPGVPDARITAAADAACPRQIVLTSHFTKCIVS
jgi:hypothetical protein